MFRNIYNFLHIASDLTALDLTPADITLLLLNNKYYINNSENSQNSPSSLLDSQYYNKNPLLLLDNQYYINNSENFQNPSLLLNNQHYIKNSQNSLTIKKNFKSKSSSTVK